MGKRNETDKAIRNIMSWAERPEWSAERTAVFDAHLDPLCDRIGIISSNASAVMGSCERWTWMARSGRG